MRLTVNQVERILERWHRLRRGNQVHFGSSDPTNLTTEARREAQQYVAANSIPLFSTTKLPLEVSQS